MRANIGRNYDPSWAKIASVMLSLFVGSICRSEGVPAVGQDKSAQDSANAPLARLRLIESALRANQSRIRTLSGSYELMDGATRTSYRKLNPDASRDESVPSHTTIEGLFFERRHVRGHFILDWPGNRLFSSYQVVDRIQIRDEATERTDEVESTPISWTNVLTSEHWLTGNPTSNVPVKPKLLEPRRGKGVNSAFRRISEEGRKRTTYGELMDPREFFRDSGNQLFSDALKATADWLENGNALPVAVTEELVGDVVHYKVRQEYRLNGIGSQEAPTVAETVFSAAVGYCPIRASLVTPEKVLQTERTWEYQAIDGVFVPSRFHIVKYANDGSGRRVIDRDYQMVDATLNSAIDDDIFTWNRIGLTEGDQVLDEIDDVTLRYRDGVLVSAKDYVDPVEPDYSGAPILPRSKPIPGKLEGISMWLLVANAGFAACIGVAWLWRRRRAHNG